jgi:hypothetical protein
MSLQYLKYEAVQSTSVAKTVGKEFSNYKAATGLVNETHFTVGKCSRRTKLLEDTAFMNVEISASFTFNDTEALEYGCKTYTKLKCHYNLKTPSRIPGLKLHT